MEESQLRQAIRLQIVQFQNQTENNPALKLLISNLESILHDPVSFNSRNIMEADSTRNLLDSRKKRRHDDYNTNEQLQDAESPGAIVGRIPLIVQKIVKNLDSVDLKNCRFVNSIWNKIVTDEMLATYSIEFVFDKDLLAYHHNSKRNNDQVHHSFLNDLVELIRKSTIVFPCSSFTFDGGTLAQDEVQEFFSIQGRFIKSLCIGSGYTDQETLRNLLKIQVPNIQNLEIDYFPDMAWEDGVNKLVLPTLKSLTCLCKDLTNSTAFDMLADTPSLQSVKNFKIKFLNYFMSKNMIWTIKCFRFCIDRLDTLGVEQLLKFSRCKPRCKFLIFPYVHGWFQLPTLLQQKFTEAINLILGSSQTSLETLQIESCFIPGVRLPPLKNVKTLILLDVSGHASSLSVNNGDGIIPNGTVVPDIFPNVEMLKLIFPIMEERLWGRYFPPRALKGVFHNVKTLEVHGFSTFWFGQLKNLLPNVTKLVLCPFGRSSSISLMRCICQHYQHIQILEIKFSWYDFMNLDHFLTGIPDADCKYLRENSGRATFDLDDMKVNNSVYDLRNLQQFKLSLQNKEMDEDEAMDIRCPSHVSGYAFSLMPGQVTIAYHKHCRSSSTIASALRSIAPYVNIIHEDVQL